MPLNNAYLGNLMQRCGKKLTRSKRSGYSYLVKWPTFCKLKSSTLEKCLQSIGRGQRKN